MLLGITQPTFMPWIGYFAFLNKIDKIILLDNVQFDKRSWHQRNNIKLNNTKHLLTVSVKSKGKFKQNISETEILYDKNTKIIKKKIYHAYSKSDYFKNYYSSICDILDEEYIYLSQMNIALIKFFVDALDIKVDIDYSSKYSFDLKKEKLIFKLCEVNNCNRYITTIGSKNYLGNHKIVPNTNIKISYFEYKFIKYNQIGDNFISNLSILDLLFNEGKNSINIINKGFKLL